MEVGQIDVDDSSSSSQRNAKNQSIEDLADDYFSAVSSIARKFITEKQEKKEHLKKNWNSLSQCEKDKVINDWFIDEGIRLRYEIRMQGARSMPDTNSIFETYPKLKVPCGAKTVQYTESDQTNQVITWRDEFSAPFSWDTKCQQNLGLYEDEMTSALDTSDSNLNSSQVSTDLDSSELFSRVKDKSNRLDSGEINIHINPTFTLESKLTGSATNSPVNNIRESQPVVTQPTAAPKPINHQINKPPTNVGTSIPTLKPNQPPPAAPGLVMTKTISSSRTSSITSRSSYSSTSLSRPSQPPPSKPPTSVLQPSQPPPSAPFRRPADTPPPPPPATKVQMSPKVSQRFSPKNQSPKSPLRKSAERGKDEQPFSKVLDEVDFKLDLDKPATRDDADKGITETGTNASEADEKDEVDNRNDAAFDFLLQW